MAQTFNQLTSLLGKRLADGLSTVSHNRYILTVDVVLNQLASFAFKPISSNSLTEALSLHSAQEQTDTLNQEESESNDAITLTEALALVEQDIDERGLLYV